MTERIFPPSLITRIVLLALNLRTPIIAPTAVLGDIRADTGLSAAGAGLLLIARAPRAERSGDSSTGRAGFRGFANKQGLFPRRAPRAAPTTPIVLRNSPKLLRSHRWTPLDSVLFLLYFFC